MPQSDYFPPAAFNFSVSIDSITSGEDLDARFQEVSGISMELEIEEVGQTGVNETKHRIPVRTKYPNLVLKRGLITANSNLAQWCHDTIQEFLIKPIEPKLITVNLLDTTGEILMSWAFENAIPVKWTISNFNAEQNAIVTESMEFVYDSFRVA